jgi:hypothetical protein
MEQSRPGIVVLALVVLGAAILIPSAGHAVVGQPILAPESSPGGSGATAGGAIAVPTSRGTLVITPQSAAPDGPVRIAFELGGERIDYSLAFNRQFPMVVFFDPGTGVENIYLITETQPMLWSSLDSSAMTSIPDWKCDAWRADPVLHAMAEVRARALEAIHAVATEAELTGVLGSFGMDEVLPFLLLIDPAEVAGECDQHPPDTLAHIRDCMAKGTWDECKTCCEGEISLAASCAFMVAGASCVVKPQWNCWKAAGACAFFKTLEFNACMDQACDGAPGDPKCREPEPCEAAGGECVYTCPIGGDRICGHCSEEGSNKICCN